MSPSSPPTDPAEDTRAESKDEALDRIVLLGGPRLNRRWYDLLATATVAGVEVGFGVLALLVVEHATGSVQLGAVAFAIGFVALLLGHSELFTEGFLVPVTTVVAKRASPAQLLKLWGGTLAANLVGGWLLMWLVVHALPDLRPTAVQSATTFVTAPLDLESAALAFLAGIAITLMTRMQHGTTSDPAKIVAAFAGGLVLAGLQLFHSILDSLVIFAALHAGAPFGYGDWLAWFWYTTLLNMAGGLLVVTLLRLVRSKDMIEEERAEAGAGA